jgi:hypothetical protein
MKKIVLAAFVSSFIFSSSSFAMLSKFTGRCFSLDSMGLDISRFFSEKATFSESDLRQVMDDVLVLMREDGIDADLPEDFWMMDR